MSHLASGNQEALLARGLQAYQSNGAALAERVLTAAYPVVAQLIGEESFAPLARYFWRKHPPTQGDMACWGADLADFLEAAPQLADEPFLADVARVEWALHTASSAVDVTPDLPSFALLASEDPQQLALKINPAATLVASAYPIVSMVQAHLLGRPSLAEAAERLQTGVSECALVWRNGFLPQLRVVNAAEHFFVSTLLAGASLQSALTQTEKAANGADPFDFQLWLAQAVQTGLVSGAGTVASLEI